MFQGFYSTVISCCCVTVVGLAFNFAKVYIFTWGWRYHRITWFVRPNKQQTSSWKSKNAKTTIFLRGSTFSSDRLTMSSVSLMRLNLVKGLYINCLNHATHRRQRRGGWGGWIPPNVLGGGDTPAFIPLKNINWFVIKSLVLTIFFTITPVSSNQCYFIRHSAAIHSDCSRRISAVIVIFTENKCIYNDIEKSARTAISSFSGRNCTSNCCKWVNEKIEIYSSFSEFMVWAISLDTFWSGRPWCSVFHLH